ncbi:MAG: hypothetical protein CMO55_20400 [Verrucomicrobiales bacterium]|nr:hypothetical protein [Verrucomicrobiales bacterium]
MHYVPPVASGLGHESNICLDGVEDPRRTPRVSRNRFLKVSHPEQALSNIVYKHISSKSGTVLEIQWIITRKVSFENPILRDVTHPIMTERQIAGFSLGGDT